MSIDFDLKTFERVSREVGGSNALLLCAFFGHGSKTFYVPNSPVDRHRLERLLGRDSFLYMIEAFGGETLQVPSLDCLKPIRAAGMISALARYKVPDRLMASACKVTPRRIAQIRAQLSLDGFPNLMDADSDESNIEGA